MSAAAPEVRFEPSGRTLEVTPGETLFDAARRAGLPVASACQADGVCGRCGLEILAGAESLSPEDERERRVKAMNRIPPALRLSCRAVIGPGGLVRVRARYW